jgi:hypothetical protein
MGGFERKGEFGRGISLGTSLMFDGTRSESVTGHAL